MTIEVNIRGRLGNGSKDDKSMRILNRIIWWTNTGIDIEADPRHVEILIKEMGLGEANPVITPGAKGREGRSEQADQPLDSRSQRVSRMRGSSKLSSTRWVRHCLCGQRSLPRNGEPYY